MKLALVAPADIAGGDVDTTTSIDARGFKTTYVYWWSSLLDPATSPSKTS
jgi:hypothetical protein